jgi:membrane-associated protease RseP (regulator of RpoE activity)
VGRSRELISSGGITIRLAGTPVTVGPAIVVGLLGLGILSRLSGEFLAEWVVLGLIALLLHELGHALAFRRYGVESSIKFWLLGGFTIPNDGEAASRLSDRQMLVVAISGPLVGLVLGGATLAVAPALEGISDSVRVPLFLWIFVNLGWGVLNLLPIAGLDGGRAVEYLGGAVFGRRGRMVGLAAGLLASAVIAAVAVAYGLYSIAFVAFVFGLVIPLASGRSAGKATPAPERPSSASTEANPHWPD